MARSGSKRSRKKHETPRDTDSAEPSFVLDTNSEDVRPEASITRNEAREVPRNATDLDLPEHVAIVSDRSRPVDVYQAVDAGSVESATGQDADGAYEQLDADGTRYYEAEANNERKRKGVCPVCGEAGHEKKRCPYQQVRENVRTEKNES